jgi:hypothetical protein
MRTIRALQAYFAHLLEGDPVALAFTALPLLFAAVVGIVAWRVRADERRWQQRRGKKPGGKGGR